MVTILVLIKTEINHWNRHEIKKPPKMSNGAGKCKMGDGRTKVDGLGGGVLPEKLGRGVRPASQNPYPIYDQNLQFSLPYL